METLILNMVVQYLVVGFLSAVVIDITLRLIKSEKPFTFMEIIGTIIGWPVILGVIITQTVTFYTGSSKEQ